MVEAIKPSASPSGNFFDDERFQRLKKRVVRLGDHVMQIPEPQAVLEAGEAQAQTLDTENAEKCRKLHREATERIQKVIDELEAAGKSLGAGEASQTLNRVFAISPPLST
jgi:hypothetical protein